MNEYRVASPQYSRDDVPDAIWPSNNEYGIPTLLTNLQAENLITPVHAWGEVARSRSMLGTWHFYVDDYRFRRVWARPYEVLNTSCAACVEVNWTVTAEMPRAVRLFRIYQKRWLARFWQTKGVRIWADASVPLNCLDDALLGIPPGWKAFAVGGTSADAEYVQDIVTELRQRYGNPMIWIVGGSESVKRVALGESCLWTPARRRRMV